MARYILAATLAVCTLSAQTGFEVASLKIVQTTSRAFVDASPGRVTIEGGLEYCLQWAYDLRPYQISGPEWLGSVRYHIAAKAPGPASVKELKLMLQSLLAERFQLKLHHESKDFMVYALVVAKTGSKLKESQTEGEGATTNAKRLGTGGTSVHTSMAELADLLNGSCPDPVVDLTGLKGRYDFALDISGYMGGMRPGDLPTVLDEALRKQLGLGLERRKVPLDVIVIDHAERTPLEN
ncbi:MAG TPA: TIGR03435 family protein [Candidatus Sulfopaludibacter sp.]|jgi:uncharacterized protein (TIGR03435 family)|nr:TIGR03435 family protein [Candidatus Sulfopaludibacter sp.]